MSENPEKKLEITFCRNKFKLRKEKFQETGHELKDTIITAQRVRIQQLQVKYDHLLAMMDMKRKETQERFRTIHKLSKINTVGFK